MLVLFLGFLETFDQVPKRPVEFTLVNGPGDVRVIVHRLEVLGPPLVGYGFEEQLVVVVRLADHLLIPNPERVIGHRQRRDAQVRQHPFAALHDLRDLALEPGLHRRIRLRAHRSQGFLRFLPLGEAVVAELATRSSTVAGSFADGGLLSTVPGPCPAWR